MQFQWNTAYGKVNNSNVKHRLKPAKAFACQRFTYLLLLAFLISPNGLLIFYRHQERVKDKAKKKRWKKTRKKHTYTQVRKWNIFVISSLIAYDWFECNGRTLVSLTWPLEISDWKLNSTANFKCVVASKSVVVLDRHNQVLLIRCYRKRERKRKRSRKRRTAREGEGTVAASSEAVDNKIVAKAIELTADFVFFFFFSFLFWIDYLMMADEMRSMD